MITYKDPDTGYMCKCSLASSVPDGVPFKEVPSHERDEFNDAITDYDNNEPVFDLNKAKEKIHEKRRNKRNSKFDVHDKIIAIHGLFDKKLADEAEEQRKIIRQEDDALQTKIDKCRSIKTLKKLMDREGL